MIALLFFPLRTQACPPPSLWMVSNLRRFSSSHPLQHRLQTLIASNPPVTPPPAAQVAVCQPAAVFFGDKHQMFRGRRGSNAGLAEMDLAHLGSQHCATPHSVQRSRCRLENEESLLASEAVISTLHVTAVGLWCADGQSLIVQQKCCLCQTFSSRNIKNKNAAGFNETHLPAGISFFCHRRTGCTSVSHSAGPEGPVQGAGPVGPGGRSCNPANKRCTASTALDWLLPGSNKNGKNVGNPMPSPFGDAY